MWRGVTSLGCQVTSLGCQVTSRRSITQRTPGKAARCFLASSWTCAPRSRCGLWVPLNRPGRARLQQLRSHVRAMRYCGPVCVAVRAEEAVRAFCCSTGHYRRTIIITSGPGVAYISSNDGNISSTRVTTIRLKIIPYHVVNHPPPGPLHQPSAPAIHVYTLV